MIYLSLTFLSFQRVESIKCRTLEFNLIILKNPKMVVKKTLETGRTIQIQTGLRTLRGGVYKGII